MSIRTAVRVISLQDSVARHEAFRAMAKDAKIDWDFFAGFKGLVEPLSYDEKRAARFFGRPLSRGEIGCYASHYKVWEWLAQSDYDQAFIFEDDIVIDWGVIEELSACHFPKMGLDFFRLYATHDFKSQTVIHRFLSPHCHLVLAKGLSFGTQGYCLTKAGAARLLANNAAIVRPVDWVMTRYWEHGLPMYSLFPFPLFEKYAPSVIGDARASEMYRLTVVDRACRYMCRVYDRLRRAWMDHVVLKKQPFGASFDTGEAYVSKFRQGSEV